MRNRVLNSSTESYRTLAGSSPTRGIRDSDGIKYHEGHIFARAMDGQDAVTIGVSSLSKIWSNTSNRVPQFLGWCASLADRLSNNQKVKTGTELDKLGSGELALSIPENVITADWSKETYVNPTRLQYFDLGGKPVSSQLLDCDLQVVVDRDDPDSLIVTLEAADLTWPFRYRLNHRPHFQLLDDQQQSIVLDRNGRPWLLIDYINSHPLRFYFSDFSSLEGRELLRSAETEPAALDSDRIELIDWARANVDIQREFLNINDGRIPIHEYVGKRLVNENNDVVFYDHGSGELADFLSVHDEGEIVTFTLYHCKGSKEEAPGERVDELYEVAGQVVKSVRWFGDHRKLQAKVGRRL